MKGITWRRHSRYSVYIFAVSLLGVASPSQAFFDEAETSGLCLAETIVSLAASFVDHYGSCPTLAGEVEIAATGYDGDQAVVVTGGSVLELANRLAVSRVRGAFCDVDAEGSIAGVPISRYDGFIPTKTTPRTHAWNRGRTIMISGAKFSLAGIDFYDEHNIKNFRKNRVPGVFLDEGLEVITKFGFPRAKWEQRSRYVRPNGTEGRLHFAKLQVTPKRPCAISLDLDGDNAGGEWLFFGSLNVTKPAVP